MKSMRSHSLPALVLTAASFVLLSGCSVLGSQQRDPVTIYAPQVTVVPQPSWPSVTWQLVVAKPTAARVVDSPRIAVRPVPGELQVYKSALWARTPPEMLEETVLRMLEDSGKIPAVARQGSGIGAEYRLVMDIRHFESDYVGGATPSAVIEVNAKLLHVSDQSIAGSRTFRHVEPAAGTEIGRVSEAFGTALGAISRDVAGWILATGNEHQRQVHR
jgi:cholesterol transport system auxiliary component